MSYELIKGFSIDGQRSPIRSWQDHQFITLKLICSIPWEQTQLSCSQPVLINLYSNV